MAYNLVQKSLFFVESGSRDIFNCFLHHGTPTTNPDAYVQVMLAQAGNLIDQIYKLGARRIALFSLGPAGCIPARALLPGAPVIKCFGERFRAIPARCRNSSAVSQNNKQKIKYIINPRYNKCMLWRWNSWRIATTNVAGKAPRFVQISVRFFSWDYSHPSEHTCKLISKALWGGKK
ncbi:hypothetical protein SADUNF_Sadunf10G0078100 [Salix dunnii]|uniref:GDSL esterase/lipase n=1 Tax=Salix dunnii TaxID=1413687 RepID=A0A835JQW6_9ROSI|nr:hypothetical protein SADUNF_Sadunf10G0078100 [Salix dunnii]